jgi:hypothetical protein
MIKTNTGRIHVAEPVHVNSSPAGALTAEIAADWAPRLDLIFTNPGKLQGQESVIEKTTPIGVYNKAFGDNDSSQPESMYSHHFNGSRLVRKQNKNYQPPVNIMQPDSAWKEHDISSLQAIVKKYPWINAFFNDTARAAYDIGGAPVVPGTRTTDNRTAWYKRCAAKLDAVNAAIPMPYHCFNGLQSDTMAAYTPCIGMVEAAFGLLDHTFPSMNAFTDLANLVEEAQQAGFTPWIYVKMNEAWDTSFWRQARRFTLTASMILDQGSLLYCLGGKEGTPPSWYTSELKNPMYNPDIGLPLDTDPWGTYLNADGVLVRTYEQGYVVCNPSTKGAIVKLAGGMSFTIPPNDGKILQAKTIVQYTEVS